MANLLSFENIVSLKRKSSEANRNLEKAREAEIRAFCDMYDSTAELILITARALALNHTIWVWYNKCHYKVFPMQMNGSHYTTQKPNFTMQVAISGGQSVLYVDPKEIHVYDSERKPHYLLKIIKDNELLERLLNEPVREHKDTFEELLNSEKNHKEAVYIP